MLKIQINCRFKGKPFAPIRQINFVVEVVSLSVGFLFFFFFCFFFCSVFFLHFFALNARVS